MMVHGKKALAQGIFRDVSYVCMLCTPHSHMLLFRVNVHALVVLLPKGNIFLCNRTLFYLPASTHEILGGRNGRFTQHCFFFLAVKATK